MTSINFNSSAQVALDTLRTVNTNLNSLNDQISTGKRVNNARDNAAIYAISTQISADVASFGKVTESLSLANSAIGVARSASESIVSLLEDAQGLIVDAQGKTGSDLTRIQTDIDNIEAQIADIVEAASFNGINLVDGSETTVDFLSSLNRTDSGLEADEITVTAQDLRVESAQAGTGAVAVGSFTGALTSDAAVTDNTNDQAIAALADGEATTLLFAGDIINAGDTFSFSFEVITGETVTAEFVAREGDTTNEVVTSLQQQIESQLAAIEAGDGTGAFQAADVGIDVTTSSRPSDNNVSIVVTNNTGTAFTGAGAYVETTGGTAGGLVGAFRDIDVTATGGPAAALASIDDLIANAIDAAASFGSSQNRIDTQTDFIQSLVDNLNAGVSSLTDADLTQASADLTALQVQQQLGLQSLAIANQGPQTILALFR